jgi:hypothetical protein
MRRRMLAALHDKMVVLADLALHAGQIAKSTQFGVAIDIIERFIAGASLEDDQMIYDFFYTNEPGLVVDGFTSAIEEVRAVMSQISSV